MLYLDLFRLATRVFKTRLRRTLLTILGLSLGFGAVLFLVSLGYGLQNVLLSQITNQEALLSLDITPSSELITLNKEYLKELSEIPEVEEVSPKGIFPSQAEMGGLSSQVNVHAIHPSYSRLEGIIPKWGRFFEDKDEGLIVVSSAAAQLFDLTPEEILNKKVDFTFFIEKEGEEGGILEVEIISTEKSYTIIGVIDDSTTSFAYFPLADLENLIDITAYTQAKIRVSESGFLEPVREQIIGRGFLVSALSDTIDQANKIFRIIQIILGFFGLIALIVSAVGMFNTMTITLLERTNEVGIMKALGASDDDISKIFLTESVIMGFLGGMGGVIVGVLGGEVFNTLVNIMARILGGVPQDLFYSPLWFILTMVVFSVVVGFLTGIFPARRAAGLHPLKALKYK